MMRSARRALPAGGCCLGENDVVSKLLVALFALTAPLAAVQADPGSAAPQPSTENPSESTPAQTTEARTPPSERRVCRRVETTGSRTDTQRVCMTPAEWRRSGQ
jgi:hypothetical protein